MRASLIFIFGLLFSLLALAGFVPDKAAASALQIRPLMYREALQPADIKKGFVDVSNPSSTAVTIQLQTRSFRQIDDRGNLRFSNSEAISKGIQLDLTEVELQPREAVRVYFQIDGRALPRGDVFAAIVASTKSSGGAGIVPSAQVGTLVIIQNGQPGPRKVTVESLQVNRLQFGSGVMGSARLRNPAPSQPESGFFPRATVSLAPVAAVRHEIQGPLVMAGNSRPLRFQLAASRLGLYKLTVKSGDSLATTWVFMITGYWRWVCAAVIALAGIAISVIIITKKRNIVRTTGTKNSSSKAQ